MSRLRDARIRLVFFWDWLTLAVLAVPALLVAAWRWTRGAIRRRRRAAGTVTISCGPSLVVFHGTRVASAGGTSFVVHWPAWRRFFYWLGFERAAGPFRVNGSGDVPVREVRD